MKKVRMSKLPKCNFCNRPAKYDAPTVTGSWAYMCALDYEEKGAGTMGSELVEGIAEPLECESIAGIIDTEQSMLNDELIVQCPKCKEIKRLELDACGTYNCEGCGHVISIPSLF